MTSALKPSWQGLKGAQDFNNPVEEVVGTIVNWRLEPNHFGDNQVIFTFANCQILKADTPFPYPDWEMSIKFSESEKSGWGMFGVSAAAALGVDIELLDIDLLKQRQVHILRSPYEYGPDKNKPELSPGVWPPMVGKVYRIIKFVQPGEPVTSVAPLSTTTVAPPATVPAPVPVTTPVTMPDPQVAPAPWTAPTPTPTPTAPIPSTAPAGGEVSSEDHALTLLHGKTMAMFFQVAVPDPIVRLDPNLVNAIMSNTFIVGMVASGRVVMDEGGVYSVVGM